MDFVGYTRFPAPVEFIASVIAYYVHPVNIETACLIMEGAEFTENIINGVECPVKAAELFAFTLCFFFSSRRRHTRCSRDWSSDVCSSDLVQISTPLLSVLALHTDLTEQSYLMVGLVDPKLLRQAAIDLVAYPGGP